MDLALGALCSFARIALFFKHLRYASLDGRCKLLSRFLKFASNIDFKDSTIAFLWTVFV